MDDNDDKIIYKRHFRCFYDGNYFGRFTGKWPKQAANKTFSSILKYLKNNGIPYELGQDLRFSIIEITRHSNKKSFTYFGRRIQLAEPVTIHLYGGKQIVYKYNNFITRDKEYELDQ